MTTPSEAKPSVQGLADWLRREAKRHDDSPARLDPFLLRHIRDLRAWASAVESLEASRIAPEGQAPEAEPWGIRDDEMGFLRTFKTKYDRDQFYGVAQDRYIKPVLFGPDEVPPQPELSPAAKAGVNCMSAWPFAHGEMTDARIEELARKAVEGDSPLDWSTESNLFHTAAQRAWFRLGARAILSARKERGDALLLKAYDAGWVQCACWAQREDLITDCDSKAYDKDREAALAPIRARLEGK